MSLATAPYRATLDAEAARLSLPPWDGMDAGYWLEGQMFQESTGVVDARHYDAPVDPDGVDGGVYEDWASYGLFQIEGITFKRLMGIPEPLRYNYSVLYYPLTNIAAGLRVIAADLDEFSGDVARALAAYNGGPKGATGPQGNLRDQAYVDLVHAKTLLVMQDRKENR